MIAPITCQFEITELCNEDCVYCYNHFRDSPSQNAFDSEGIAKRIAQNDIFYVVVTGGEPFLVKDKLFATASIFRENNIDFSVNTNLTLPSAEDLRYLKGNGMLSILTSVISYDPTLHDRIKQRAGSFRKLMLGVERAKNEDIQIAVNMVINKMNKDQVYETGRFLHERFGDISFCATPIMPAAQRSIDSLAITREEYIQGLDSLLRLKSEFNLRVDSLCPPLPCIFDNLSAYSYFFRRACVGGRSTFTVSADGQIRPCSHSDEKYGNIFEEGVREILEKMVDWRDESHIPKECKICSYASSCRGGCRTSALAFSHDLKGVHPFYKGPKKDLLVGGTERLKYKNDQVVKNANGKLRYRTENNGLLTIYLNPFSFATITEDQFQLFRLIRSYSGSTFEQIKKETGLEEGFLSESFEIFLDRKLLNVS